jgi:hypothetical protein
VRIHRVVSRSELGEKVEHQRCEGELNNHVHACREQREGKHDVRLVVFRLKHPLVVLFLLRQHYPQRERERERDLLETE